MRSRWGLTLVVWLLLPALAWAGAGRDFDGDNDSINFGDTTILDGLGAFTTSLWVRVDALPASAGTYISVLRKDLTLTTLQFENNAGTQQVRCAIWDPSANTSNVTNTWETGVWKHSSCAWQNSASTGDPTIYKNATSLGSPNANATSTLADGANAMIFGLTESDTEDYDGQMAHVQYFNRKLTLIEITELMWKPQYISAELGLWPLWGTESPEPNLVAATPTGTVTGATESSDGPPIFFAMGGG